MEKFNKVTGVAAPLPMVNIDTDKIIPKQFLKTIARTGLAKGLFYELRTDESGKPTGDFVLDREPYTNAEILVAGDNFGCGSSREHAPWAIDQYGFRAILAPSFADIFFNNCFKNGLLPIVLPEPVISKLFDEVLAFPGFELTIDLQAQVVRGSQLGEVPFEVEAFRKHCLTNGLDDIGLTLLHTDKIKTFEAERLARMPWLAHTMVNPSS